MRLREAWRDYRETVSAFTGPARRLLFSTFLAWGALGIHQVLFNLYLVEGGLDVAFAGRVSSLNGLGLAIGALPAGWLADRWGRWPCLVWGIVFDALGLGARSITLSPDVIGAASFLAGVGMAMTAVAAIPFLTDHSTPRERAHLFSAFFASELVAGVLGSIVGGWAPRVFLALGPTLGVVFGDGTLGAYRSTLMLAAVIELAAMLPLLAVAHGVRSPTPEQRLPFGRAERKRLVPIAANAILIGMGAGLVIPFMNLYFKNRFDCSSAQIGMFFSVAQLTTAFAAMIGPVVARRYGKLRTALVSELLSLPFLVTLGFERHLEIAVAAFWLRATFMQASTPLIGTFIMEVLPPGLRGRAASLINLLWNLGWAMSATLSGVLIARFGHDVPFYCTAALYACAVTVLFVAFRKTPETAMVAEAARAETPVVPEETKGARGQGPSTE